MSQLTPIEVYPDASLLARRAAELIGVHAHRAIAQRGEFTLAVSGGRTPWLMFALLASLSIDWQALTIFQVDERVAPAGDSSRNLTHLLESLPAPARGRLVPMPVEDLALEDAARRYARKLPERFDLIHLGLGPDGHTASLVPDDPVLDVQDRDVALSGPYQGQLRMTLTYPVLNRARSRLWVVTGEDKTRALALLREHDRSIPGGRVEAIDTLILADAEAAGETSG